jgi:hypothetical protein
VIVMTPAPVAMELELVTPSGRRIPPGTHGAGIGYRAGENVVYFRLDPGSDLSVERAGRWVARLSVSDARFALFRESRVKEARVRAMAHGVPYDLMVISRSSLTMRVRSYSTGFEPGSRIRLRAQVLDGGEMLVKPVSVSARIVFPDRTRTNARLRPLSSGVYEHAFDATLPGVYTSLVRASGFNSRGEHFTREQVVTSHIWARAAGTTTARTLVRVR